jgi:hypothetical protein
MNNQTREALEMAREALEDLLRGAKEAEPDWNWSTEESAIQAIDEALEAEKPFDEGFRILVEYRNGDSWLRNQKRFSVYEPLVISDFATKVAGDTCMFMTEEIMKAYNNG